MATEELYKFITSLYLKFVVSKSNSFTFNIYRCIPRRYERYAVLWEPRTGKISLSKVKGVCCVRPVHFVVFRERTARELGKMVL